MQGLHIIYEDEAMIVCHKAPGIPTQSAKVGQIDMVSLLTNHRKEQGEELYVGLVQRLDQPVEGLLVVGKTPEVTANLSRQVRERAVVKEYYAVVTGDAEESAELTDYLIRDGRNNVSRVGKADEKDAKRSQLFYRKLEEKNGKSLLLVTLKTGRHHQIRVQLSHAGIPIVGDKKYGNASAGYLPLGLCSCHLKFTHPETGETVEFRAKPEGKAFEDFAF